MRSRTTGLGEFTFAVDEVAINVIDVGGQRAERRKWLHCFMNVTTIVFFVALSDYDMTLREDSTVKLFEDVINGSWFQDTPVVLFLNKKDLFREKLGRIDLKCCFPHYDGGKEYGPAVKYIEKQFLSLAPPKKQIFVHRTCATDTKNISLVFKAVKDILLQQRHIEDEVLVEDLINGKARRKELN